MWSKRKYQLFSTHIPSLAGANNLDILFYIKKIRYWVPGCIEVHVSSMQTFAYIAGNICCSILMLCNCFFQKQFNIVCWFWKETFSKGYISRNVCISNKFHIINKYLAKKQCLRFCEFIIVWNHLIGCRL